MRVVATEYIIGTEADLVSSEVKLGEISPDVYYPTEQQPDKEEDLTEESFKGYPVEEVRCWEGGKVVTKFLIVVGEFAYDLQ